MAANSDSNDVNAGASSGVNSMSNSRSNAARSWTCRKEVHEPRSALVEASPKDTAFSTARPTRVSVARIVSRSGETVSVIEALRTSRKHHRDPQRCECS